MLKRLLFLGFLLTISACDSSDFSVLDNKFVVELMLVANEPVPAARISELAPTDVPNEFKDVAVTNAEVILSTASIDLLLEPRADSLGVYEYLGEEHIIEPGGTYQIRVTIPNQSTAINGTTNVPSSLKIISASRESGTYLSDEQLVLVVTPGRASDQKQSNFTLVTRSLDAEMSSAVPTVLDLLDDDDMTLEDFIVSGSPIIGEGNFIRFPDNSIELVYPWIGVNFYGRNVIYVNSLDNNMTDFVRSIEQQQGGDGAFGPGVIPNALPTLSGAHGLFGSVARDSIPFMVFRPSD